MASVFLRQNDAARHRHSTSSYNDSPVLAALRQQIAALLDPPRVDAGVIPTGIVELDAALSGGGIPRGRLTELTGPRGGGKTTLVRELVAAAIASRRWVAYVDASRTLSPRDWVAEGASGLLWVVRPRDSARGAWCADVLLRSSAFGLVVLDGAPVITRAMAVRLTRLAQESDAAFVLMRDADDRSRGQVVASAVRLRLAERAGGRQGNAGRGFASTMRAITVVVEKGGPFRSMEVSCVIDVARRLCAHAEVPDRRGVALRNRRGERAGSDVPGARRSVAAGVRRDSRGNGDSGRDRDGPVSGTAATPVLGGSTLAHKRRCAEPVVRRDAFLLADPSNGRRGRTGMYGGSALGHVAAGGRGRTADPGSHDRRRAGSGTRRHDGE